MEKLFDLETRTSWPAELLFILEKYPRDAWLDHVNIAGMGRFWLERHDSFRRSGEALRSATGEFREGLVTPERFRAWHAPRPQTFLSHLEAHHDAEDYQMFPIFNAAEPRLMKGFDVLERDHGVIHAAMEQVAETANAFMRTPASATRRVWSSRSSLIVAREPWYRRSEN